MTLHGKVRMMQTGKTISETDDRTETIMEKSSIFPTQASPIPERWAAKFFTIWTG
jgi:hypothetical protein